MYRIDALGAPYMNIFASSWALLGASLLIAAPVIFLKIRDHVPIEDDLKFTDETLSDVVPEAQLVTEKSAMVTAAR